MSAKEAVSANCELAVAGICVGRLIGERIVALSVHDVPYGVLVRPAQIVSKSMLQRFNAALKVHTDGSGITTQGDPNALADAVDAANHACDAEPRETERAAVLTAFAQAMAMFDKATLEARAALTAREDGVDVALMSEQLSIMADYLDSGA